MRLGIRDRGTTLAALSLAALGFAACGRSPAKEREEASKKLQSWNATMQLLERERARGAVPEEFAEQVRRAADEERKKAEAQLRKAGGR